jgi:hypothetical protein
LAAWAHYEVQQKTREKEAVWVGFESRDKVFVPAWARKMGSSTQTLDRQQRVW